MSSIPKTGFTPDQDLGAIYALPVFRGIIDTDPMTAADRETLVEQAATMIDGVYAHLLQKRAMYGSDPSQLLRLLQRRLPQLTDRQFHAELLRIFIDLRDLHTNYILPRPYQGPDGLEKGPFAFLGILLEQYWTDSEPHWMVSKIWNGLTGDPHLVHGAEVTHWNGSPIALAVARNAELEAGSNPAARLARGLESMTLRTPAISLPPDEDWVDLRYQAGGAVHETRLPWQVFDTVSDLSHPVGSAGDTPLAAAGAPASHLLGLDLRTELIRDVKKKMFAPGPAADEPRRAAEEPPAPQEVQGARVTIPTKRTEIAASTVTTAHGTFGHLRIFTFKLKQTYPILDTDFDEFFKEMTTLLPAMPPAGLILDVRGNGGGYGYIAETMLQYFTPRRIQPEPTQFISTPMTAELCAAVPDLNAWGASISASVETGAQHSRALPLYGDDSEGVVNKTGQLYHGPVVLVTDALCYSATDFFAAGFQDHQIGTVLGVDDNTGAGGANVWDLSDLRKAWPDGPFKPLPGGAGFRVALRRSLRVGNRWGGQVVEDLGVIPDVRYEMTARDLLEGNVDLLEKAGELLAQGTPRTLEIKVDSHDNSSAALEVTTATLTSVDIYVNGRPATSAVVLDGINTITVPLSGPAPTSLRVEGFDNQTLVAASTVTLS